MTVTKFLSCVNILNNIKSSVFYEVHMQTETCSVASRIVKH
jgi:hypothetical protein